jgi:NADH-quinone oxidoreductase subunit G
MADINITVDGKKVTAPAGTLVIEACKTVGIEVPSFCYYPNLALQGACRMCLVKVEKMPKLQTACTTVVGEGMIVTTDSDEIKQARKSMVEMLLGNHPLDCPVCDAGGECELQDMTFSYGAAESKYIELKQHRDEQQWSPVVYFDRPRCILCYRCVRVCGEAMDVAALGIENRGAGSTIVPNQQDHLDCEECGMCIDICPVGALTSGTYRYKTRPWEMTYAPTVCTHCSNGCKVTLSVRNNEVLRANNRDLSGINGEFLCAKGRFGFDFTTHPERLRLPMVRRNGKLQPTTWEDAIGEVSSRLAEIHKKNGANAIGFIGSNRTTNEENYLLQRIARGAFGTNNIDHHRTADYAGLISALGHKAAEASATMEHIAKASAILLIGNDATNQNPLVAWQIRSAIRHNAARLYVVNSQTIPLTRKATVSVTPAAGAENNVIRWLATGEGSSSTDLSSLKERLAKEADVVILFGAGISGASVKDLIAYGSTLTGQTRYMALGDYNNSRGAADMGLLPDRMPGFASTSDSSARERFGSLWGAKVSDVVGMSAKEMLAAAKSGKLKALYVVGANPFKTFEVGADRPKGLELLVVHELFMTETSKHADVIFPAASSYEKSGTVTNTAGEVQRLQHALDPVGARSDFDLLRILSHQLAKLGLGSGVTTRSPEALFEEIRANVAGYDVAMPALLSGAAALAAPHVAVNGKGAAAPAGTIFSSQDNLFTSGTLGRYFQIIPKLDEAETKS